MSNINRELDWSQLSTVLDNFHEQRIKTLSTAMPALIEVFDQPSRRARVQPALSLLLTDGTTMRRAPIVDVPVVFPAGGGFSLIFPLAPGDAGMLLFSMRGILEFKRAYMESPPTADRLFDLSDAVFLAGFGPISLMPATATGTALQTEDGATSLRVEPRDVVAVAPGEVSVTGGARVRVSAPRIDLN